MTSDVMVSVIIPSYRAAATLIDTLESFQAQRDPGRYEVIVVDSTEDSSVVKLMQRYPWARLLRLETRAWPGDARNAGIAISRGEILAFTDADCSVGPDWIDRVRRAHEGTLRIVGGTIANADMRNLIGWMYHFCKFSYWLPGGDARPMRDIPTTCLTMRREVFQRFGPFEEERYSSDSAFNWRIGDGLPTPLLSPGLEVSHRGFTSFNQVRSKLLAHSRDYARLRATEAGWSVARRAMHVVSAPLLVPLL